MLDGEKTKLNSEVNDLQNRVARDEEREEESRKESFGLKQKVTSLLTNVMYRIECADIQLSHNISHYHNHNILIGVIHV